jgi:hypothetical protein
MAPPPINPFPIVGALLTQLNNLPGFPVPVPFPPPPAAPVTPGFRLGDYLNSLTAEASGMVVFRPGDPNPVSGVYTEWLNAFTAVKIKTGARAIYIDTTFGAAVIPVGTPGLLIPGTPGALTDATGAWDFDGEIGLIGPIGAAPMVLTVADGATLTRLPSIRGLTVASASATPVLTIPASGGVTIMILDLGANLRCDALGTFVDVQAGGVLALACLGFNTLASGGLGPPPGTPVIRADGTVLVIMGMNTRLDDCVVGNGVLLAQIVSTASVCNPQVAFAGTVVVQHLTNASSLGYQPAAPPDWAGDPRTAWEALNRLATAVAGLLGGPIP